MPYQPSIIASLPDWTVIIGFFIGTVAGSFLNMVIYRLPRGISFWNPSHSICPVCKHKLDWIDLMPLFSWLSTRGKCRYCRVPIPIRYQLVELLCGFLFAGIWWQYLSTADQPVTATFYMAAAACLVAVIYIDWELYIIPDELNAVILFVGLGYGIASGDVKTSLFGALTGWGLLWGITFLGRVAFGKDAMGHGDIKLMRGMGALLGPMMTGVSLMMAVVVGLIVGIVLMVVEKQKASAQTESEAEEEMEEYVPESIPSVLKFGVWYLLCLDVVGIFVPSIYKLIGEEVSSAATEEIDDWKPTATTIPFGPYLAAGCLVCMLFAGPVQGAVDRYLDQFKGSSASRSQ